MRFKNGITKCAVYSISMLSAVLGSLLLLTSFLLFTHIGTQVVIKVVKLFEPRLSIELVQGSLFQSPHFKDITWLAGETEIRINHADYQFDWSCLLDSLCLTTLNIDGVQITVPEADDLAIVQRQPKSKPLSIDFPLEIIISDINISALHFQKGDLAVDLDNISLQATAFANENDVTLSTKISGLLITLANRVSLVIKKRANTHNKKTAKNLQFDSIPALLTKEMLPNISLPIQLNVQQSLIDNVKIVQDKQTLFELTHLATAFTWQQTQLDISQFALNLPETDLNLSAQINFIDDYPLEIVIDGQLKKIKQLQPASLLSGINYHFKSTGRLSDLSSELNISNHIDLQLKTHFDLLADNLPHNITLNWQQLRWPLTGEAQYSTKQGRFTSQGSLLDQRMTLHSDYNIADMPNGVISLTTQGDLQHLQVESLNLKTLSGQLDFSGLLTWGKRIDWLGQLQITDIDLASLKTQYDGHFSGLIKQQACLTLYDNSAPEWQFDFPALNIAGEFLSRPLSVVGHVSGDNKQGISFDDLTIKNAQNSLQINGQLAKQNNLDIDINLVDLSHLLVGAKGKVKGSLKLQGPIESLLLKSQLATKRLSYQDYQSEQIELDSTLLLTKKPQLTLSLTAQALSIANQKIDKIKLNISNKKSTDNNVQHKIELSVNNQLMASKLLLFVTQTDDALLAQLNRAKISVENQSLTLTSPVDIKIRNGVQGNAKTKQIDISAHCWQAATAVLNDAGKLCIKQFNAGESGNIVVDVKDYQLTTLNQFLPAQLNIEGGLSADAHLHWIKDNKINFDINMLSNNMLLKIKRNVNADNFNLYPMQSFNINLHGSDKDIEVNAKLFADNLIDLQLKGQLQPYQKQPSIDAKISAKVPDFSLFLPLVPALDELAGQLKSELTITGKLNKPNINGVINIQNGVANGAELPIKVTKLDAVITLDKQSANLQASFDSSNTNTLIKKVRTIPLITDTINILDRTIKDLSSVIIKPLIEQPVREEKNTQNPGIAYLKGNVDWSNKLQGDIHFYANQLEIYDYGKVDLLISPDIHLLLNEHLKIAGELLINRGKIVVQALPEGAISPSEDIVVIDAKNKTVTQQLPIIINLEVDSGNDLQIVALGLDTFMQGKLSIEKPLKKDLTINGVLTLNNGSYRSFGQQLVLQNSRIIFQGLPESPYLRLEAIRDSSKVEDDVIAGVRVTGTPDELSLVIFSEPAMAQQEALSYLTRGQGLSSSSENGTMANMLIDLAAGQSGGVMSSIGKEIGIKDLSLSSTGIGDEQSVGISGEIAPGVELSYGVGVFDDFSILSLRYELFERFYIEASSGIYQAIDAYYEWDWD